MATPEATACASEPDYAKIADLSWRTLRRLGVPTSSLPDAAQDALLVLHRRREEFRGDSSYATWVYGVLLRVASDYRRKARRAATVFEATGDDAAERATSRQPSPLDVVERRSAVELLHKVLDTLSGEGREVFVMVELEELTIPEAAEALGIRATTCKSRLRTARRAFNTAVARHRATSEGRR